MNAKDRAFAASTSSDADDIEQLLLAKDECDEMHVVWHGFCRQESD